MRIHIWEKVFSCHLCELAFLDNSSLKNSHAYTHRRKTFSWEVCQSRFSQMRESTLGYNTDKILTFYLKIILYLKCFLF